MIKEVRVVPNAEEFIAHHGIKGMKWGVVNEDAEKKYKKKLGEKVVEKVENIFGKKSESQEAVEQGKKRALDDRNRINEGLMHYGKGNKAQDNALIQNCESFLKQINDTLILHNSYDLAKISDEERTRAVENFNYLVDNFEKKFETPLEEHSIYKALVATNDAFSDLFQEYEAEKGVTPLILEETNPELFALSKSYELLKDQLIKEVCEASGWPSDNEKINKSMEKMLNLVELLPEKGKKTSQIAHSDFEEIDLPYLVHHGIKGQKWGIRRFQNYDGTLIKSAGRKEKKHYEYDSGTKEYKKSEARHLTDEELKKRVNRLTQENNYRDQLKKAQEASMSKRKKLVNKIFVESAQNAASTVMQTVYTKSATAFLKNNFPALMGEGDKKKKTTSA